MSDHKKTTKNQAANWLDNMPDFEEVSNTTAFADAHAGTYWKHSIVDNDKQIANNAYVPNLTCNFKITKKDNARMVAIRVPAELEEKIKSLSLSDAFSSILLALADLKADELRTENKRVIVTNKED